MNVKIKRKPFTTFEEIPLGECFVWDACTYQKIRPAGETVPRHGVQSGSGVFREFEPSTLVIPVNATLVIEK